MEAENPLISMVSVESESKLSAETRLKMQDWEEYYELSRQIRIWRDSKLSSFRPTPPKLISVNQTDLVSCAESIHFSLPDHPLISIIIPVFNNIQLTLECLVSIQKNTNQISYEIILVDDHSDQGDKDIIAVIRNIKLISHDEQMGFSLACNHGAKQASGEYFLFLNNDVQVTEGWLESLMNCFTSHDCVGAIGPKILSLDGRLQEAGASINPDGTAILIGFNDNPALPRYNSIREVEYCSGVCLLVKAKTFDTICGFDEEYAPAYYEDVDFCFKIREKGLRILYNPNSTVFHHLSATTTNIDSDFKLQWVTCNRQKFLGRWQSEIDELNRSKLIAIQMPQAPNTTDKYYQQEQLAKRSGIYGFCYHWHPGEALPFETKSNTNVPNIPFCICWSYSHFIKGNGGYPNPLSAISENPGNDSAIIKDLIRHLKNPGYIRIDGRPLVIVYAGLLIPDLRQTTQGWRKIFRQEGIGEIHLVWAGNFEFSPEKNNLVDFGLDAFMEFPTLNQDASIERARKENKWNSPESRKDYRNELLKNVQKDIPEQVEYRVVIIGQNRADQDFDAPIPDKNSSPGAYQAWLEETIRLTREQESINQRFVFIDGWNELDEGELQGTDLPYRYRYLEATRNSTETWLLRRHP
jgi:GT2 family glycosyltransferase